MAKWKLSRQTFGSEELIFSEEEEVTIGRGINNTVTLSSIVISRNHGIIHFKQDEVTITDLKSSNGIYVGLKKIPPNIPFSLQESDIIGFGWTIGAPLANIADSEKYIFKLTKHTSLSHRILFQNENDIDDIEAALANLDNNNINSEININSSPVARSNSGVKRKFEETKGKQVDNKIINKKHLVSEEVINISDSDIEISTNKETNKKMKLEIIPDEAQVHIKTENDDLQYEAFNVKQEYLGYDDEAILIDSDSDSESEHWFLRLSQSSPGKPFTKIKSSEKNDNNDSSYSQAEDFMMTDIKKNNNELEEEFSNVLINEPHLPFDFEKDKEKPLRQVVDTNENWCSPMDTQSKTSKSSLIIDNQYAINMKDTVDAIDCENIKTKELNKATVRNSVQENKEKETKIQLIEPLVCHKAKPKLITQKNKNKETSKEKSSFKKHITNSQKEERKKKLKEIASKEKEKIELTHTSSVNTTNKQVVSAKITKSNRGAFLTNHEPDTTQSTKIKTGLNKSKNHERELEENMENKKKESSNHWTKKHESSKTKNKIETLKTFESDSRIPLKSVKPLKENDETISGKPFSKVEPLPPKVRSPIEKPVKKVRFIDKQPTVYEFQIEPGNRMNKTSSIKTALLDVRHMPVFSLEKITLTKILRWNTHWLDEQSKTSDPPPILGYSSPPMAILHSFSNHKQYIQLVGDLLLMEIWECLTQGYKRISNHSGGLEMRIDSLPPVPPKERCLDLSSLDVNISVPMTEIKNVPRIGELLLVTYGQENWKNTKFFYVHNVRCLPSPANNVRSFFTLSLYATFTEKMGLLRPGEIMFGKSLAYINKELTLFEAMEHLAGSPLSEVILKPAPHNFRLNKRNYENELKSQWTITLNPSQKLAVNSSVSAALRDKPCIQMVQGPPGTGKSSVICAIVMTYFYNSSGRKHQARGKILICATSNAAVDELVIRLLNIRQSLPKTERFRMVRVGREEAMHSRARDISSQNLAQRDAARSYAEPAQPGLAEEISHLEAKINMWRTQALNARDPVRVAYCESRVENLINRIALFRGGNGGGGNEEVRPKQVAKTERKIIEGADIVVTTLASAHNPKMRGLRRRIALCIVDEAGQAIEPETLIPLTLDVTKLTLIGDPQQLPGFICSQRAKKHGLGESLFSRLSSSVEDWKEGNPIVLLNQQYRMHPDIADYPNRAFYGGKIQTVPPPPIDLQIPPYCIVSIASGDKGQGTSGANEMEAWGVARLAVALSSLVRPKGRSLAVITPYSAHRDVLRRNLRAIQESSEAQVEVNTVDSFQGQERDVVVVSLARSHGVGFLTDAGRMNVMLTRARHALIICLNPLAVTKNHQWRTLVEDAQKRKVYRVLPNKFCQGASSPHTPDEILKHIKYLKPTSDK